MQSDIKELSKLTRSQIEKRFKISGKKGKEGTTFVAKGRSKKEYAIKLFSAKKASSRISAEAALQKSAAAVGVAPMVYAVNSREKYIIMDKMKETIVEYLKRKYPNGRRPLSKDMQAQVYALCMRLDKAGVVQNDGNPLNLMLDDSDRLYIIDYGFSKKITPAVVKRRGSQPNINLTLWHFISQLRHYRTDAPLIDAIQKRYLKDNTYVDDKLLARGNTLLDKSGGSVSIEESSSSESESSSSSSESESEDDVAVKKLPRSKRNMTPPRRSRRTLRTSTRLAKKDPVPVEQKEPKPRRRRQMTTPKRKSKVPIKKATAKKATRIQLPKKGDKVKFYFPYFGEVFSGILVNFNKDGSANITYKSGGKPMKHKVEAKDLNPK
tara:strand:- start:580 stop:1719 length:1140 start_codon:yes stop_codon:yes gene_type:complete